MYTHAILRVEYAAVLCILQSVHVRPRSLLSTISAHVNDHYLPHAFQSCSFSATFSYLCFHLSSYVHARPGLACSRGAASSSAKCQRILRAPVLIVQAFGRSRQKNCFFATVLNSISQTNYRPGDVQNASGWTRAATFNIIRPNCLLQPSLSPFAFLFSTVGFGPFPFNKTLIVADSILVSSMSLSSLQILTIANVNLVNVC